MATTALGSCSALLAGGAHLPSPWIATGVETADDDCPLTFEDVEDAVGESAQERSANRSVYDGEALWKAGDGGDALIEDSPEILSEAHAALGVPEVSLLDVGSSLRSKANLVGHEPRWSLARTSSQGVVRLGSPSCRASLRSSSARWAAVTGSCSGVAAMLSQIFSARGTRSGTLSGSISS